MKEVKVKLYQDNKVHIYNENIAERLEASGRGKIIGVVGGVKAMSKAELRLKKLKEAKESEKSEK